MPYRGACRCRAGRDEIHPVIRLYVDSVDDVEGVSHVMRHHHRTAAAVRGARTAAFMITTMTMSNPPLINVRLLGTGMRRRSLS